MTSETSPAQKLRDLLADQANIVVGPGIYDGFTARIALAAGFNCLYVTGAGTSMSRLGMPDLGLATLNDMRDNAAMIASLDRSVPVIADMDTGYGGALMVGRAVDQYIAAGVAAFHIEDQVVSKRCGHLGGKVLVDEEEWTSRIRACVAARAQSGRDIVIIARTDALQGMGYDAALHRLKLAMDLGADVAFLEGIQTKEQGKQICKDLAPKPVLLNMVQGGNTPHYTAAAAKEDGFRMIIYPGLTLGPVFKGVFEACKKLQETGDVDKVEGGNVKAVFGVCGLKECVAFDLAAGGRLYENGI